MLNWLDIIKYAKNGNPKPDRYVVKTDDEWKSELTEEQFRVTRKHGTERAFTGEHCSVFEPALYGCVCCGNWLFESREKFESGSGWPSFTQPVKSNAIKYIEDHNLGMRRIETQCNVCSAHLGHVFPDGPMPSGLRYCMNSAALAKVKTVDGKLKLATFGGGCFWCTEAIFRELRGVHSVLSGYSGGSINNPTYKEVSSGMTGHAEVIQVVYDESVINLEDLIRMHLHSHDPTSLNRQGADFGTQYRSIIFYKNDEEKARIESVLNEERKYFDRDITTELVPFEFFVEAESYHQDYYRKNKNSNNYCSVVIDPKLKKLRDKYSDKVESVEKQNVP